MPSAIFESFYNKITTFKISNLLFHVIKALQKKSDTNEFGKKYNITRMQNIEHNPRNTEAS